MEEMILNIFCEGISATCPCKQLPGSSIENTGRASSIMHRSFITGTVELWELLNFEKSLKSQWSMKMKELFYRVFLPIFVE
jgi:hypothetical protein